MLTTAGTLTQILVLVLFVLVLLAKDRVPAIGRRLAIILWGLALVALLAHAEFFAGDRLHLHEFYHYYVNTKYFPELGYTGLYDATVIADYEDDPGSYDPNQGVRSLETYEMGPRRASLDRAGSIRGRFTPERWAAFKSDLAFFRETDGVLWKMGESLRDHGYNGTPLDTAILGGLARQPFLPTPVFIRLAAWLDTALILVAAALVSVWVAPAAGPLFLLLFAANPLNDNAYIGWAYLRYLHVIALLVAMTAFARRRLVWSGASLAVATLLRVFPGVLIAGLLAQNVLSRDRRTLLRRHAPFYAAAAGTALILVAATSLVPYPGGGNSWVHFTRKIALHTQRISPNVVGLPYLFFYSDAHNVARIMEERNAGIPANWIVEAEKTFAANRGLYLGTLAALGLALAVLLRRGCPEDGFLAGLVLVFAALHLAHYDYCVLALVPFMFPGRRDILLALAVFLVAAAAARLLPKAAEVLDFRFYAWSLLLSFYFLATLALRARDAAPAPGLQALLEPVPAARAKGPARGGPRRPARAAR